MAALRPPMAKAILVAMSLFSFLFGSCAKQSAQPAASAQPIAKFRAGQIWAFKTSSAQPNDRAPCGQCRQYRPQPLHACLHVRASVRIRILLHALLRLVCEFARRRGYSFTLKNCLQLGHI